MGRKKKADPSLFEDDEPVPMAVPFVVELPAKKRTKVKNEDWEHKVRAEDKPYKKRFKWTCRDVRCTGRKKGTEEFENPPCPVCGGRMRRHTWYV